MLKIIGNNKIDQLDDILVMYSKHPPQTDSEKNELYEYCLEYVKWYMIKNEKKLNKHEYEFVKLHVSEELYFRLLRTDLPKIEHVTMYMDSGQYICTLKEALHLIGVRNNHSSSYNGQPYSSVPPKRYSTIPIYEMMEKDFLIESMNTLFDSVNKFIRYYNWSSSTASLNARISISLSIKYNSFQNFHLNKEDEAVCRFLFNKYRCTLRKLLLHMSSINDGNVDEVSESLFWEIKLQNGEIAEGVD